MDVSYMILCKLNYLFKVISKEQSVFTFKAIAFAKEKGIDVLLLAETNLNISQNHYYSILSNLTHQELIKRNKGRYYLTPLGKIVYDQMKIIENILYDQSKLKVFESK